jgi:hypothetical protein
MAHWVTAALRLPLHDKAVDLERRQGSVLYVSYLSIVHISASCPHMILLNTIIVTIFDEDYTNITSLDIIHRPVFV